MESHNQKDNYLKIYYNGLAHYNAATLLADNGYWGFAVSHLVLSMEEYIKYLVIYIYYTENNIDKSLLKLNEHNKKHDLLKRFQRSTEEKLNEHYWEVYITNIFEKDNPTKPSKELSTNPFILWGNLVRWGILSGQDSFTKEEEEAFMKWINKATTERMKGTYVDVVEQNEKWMSPLDVKRTDFELVLRFATIMKKRFEFIKNMEEDDGFLNELVGSIVEALKRYSEKYKKIELKTDY